MQIMHFEIIFLERGFIGNDLQTVLLFLFSWKSSNSINHTIIGGGGFVLLLYLLKSDRWMNKVLNLLIKIFV